MLKSGIINKKIEYIAGIPCGGIPVAIEIHKRLKIPLEVVIVRKILIPWDKEAGYGAVAPDGSFILNEPLVSALGLGSEHLRSGINETLNEIRRREKMFRCNRDYTRLKGKNVVLIDDGLASGYTMLAAIQYLKRVEVGDIYVAVPTASPRSIVLISRHVNGIFVANVRDDMFGFAVADAYKFWRDISDEEVILMLKDVGYLNECL